MIAFCDSFSSVALYSGSSAPSIRLVQSKSFGQSGSGTPSNHPITAIGKGAETFSTKSTLVSSPLFEQVLDDLLRDPVDVRMNLLEGARGEEIADEFAGHAVLRVVLLDQCGWPFEAVHIGVFEHRVHEESRSTQEEVGLTTDCRDVRVLCNRPERNGAITKVVDGRFGTESTPFLVRVAESGEGFGTDDVEFVQKFGCSAHSSSLVPGLWRDT